MQNKKELKHYKREVVAMYFWLRELVEEVAKVDPADIPEPLLERGEGDIFVGMMPKELMAFYAIYRKAKEENDRRKNRHGWLFYLIAKLTLRRSDDWKELLARKRYKVISDLFWHSVTECFPRTAGEDCVDLRKGWIVVIAPSIYDLFRDPRSGGYFHM